ncbi:sugar phosphate isomerase/epimerase family protein [Aeoliella sp.]|uniref:sugar phosphate isomerase/epimerase family protein n=1 Tax=Aeoliella sp. TaxID=2795800 RepID=UPI003CCB927F
MFICASTECFPELGPREVLQQLVDLEYTGVELTLHETDGWMKPSEVLADLERAVQTCGDTHRMHIAALSIEIEATGDDYYKQFAACCKLAKAIKVVTLVVPSSELGTPFNEEIERLKSMVAIAAFEGAVVAMKTTIGSMSQDPDTAAVICDNVKGLALALDPSHYIAGPNQGRNYDKLMKYTQHVHLRDTTKNDLQVRVGQGEVDYGRLVQQLAKEKYNRALSVHITPSEDVDHHGEMRKMRLLLDSLL